MPRSSTDVTDVSTDVTDSYSRLLAYFDKYPNSKPKAACEFLGIDYKKYGHAARTAKWEVRDEKKRVQALLPTAEAAGVDIHAVPFQCIVDRPILDAWILKLRGSYRAKNNNRMICYRDPNRFFGFQIHEKPTEDAGKFIFTIGKGRDRKTAFTRFSGYLHGCGFSPEEAGELEDKLKEGEGDPHIAIDITKGVPQIKYDDEYGTIETDGTPYPKVLEIKPKRTKIARQQKETLNNLAESIDKFTEALDILQRGGANAEQRSQRQEISNIFFAANLVEYTKSTNEIQKTIGVLVDEMRKDREDRKKSRWRLW
jgi:hypothetical protein